MGHLQGDLSRRRLESGRAEADLVTVGLEKQDVAAIDDVVEAVNEVAGVDDAAAVVNRIWGVRAARKCLVRGEAAFVVHVEDAGQGAVASGELRNIILFETARVGAAEVERVALRRAERGRSLREGSTCRVASIVNFYKLNATAGRIGGKRYKVPVIPLSNVVSVNTDLPPLTGVNEPAKVSWAGETLPASLRPPDR